MSRPLNSIQVKVPTPEDIRKEVGQGEKVFGLNDYYQHHFEVALSIFTNKLRREEQGDEELVVEVAEAALKNPKLTETRSQGFEWQRTTERDLGYISKLFNTLLIDVLNDLELPTFADYKLLENYYNKDWFWKVIESKVNFLGKLEIGPGDPLYNLFILTSISLALRDTFFQTLRDFSLEAKTTAILSKNEAEIKKQLASIMESYLLEAEYLLGAHLRAEKEIDQIGRKRFGERYYMAQTIFKLIMFAKNTGVLKNWGTRQKWMKQIVETLQKNEIDKARQLITRLNQQSPGSLNPYYMYEIMYS